MKYECDRINDEIWELGGENLPADIREHISACPDCERAAVEARKILPMVRAASAAPEAPDCRQAVMRRISAKSPSRLAWAYAVAPMLLAALILTGVLTQRSGPEDPTAQLAIKPEVRQSVETPGKVMQKSMETPKTKTPRQTKKTQATAIPRKPETPPMPTEEKVVALAREARQLDTATSSLGFGTEFGRDEVAKAQTRFFADAHPTAARSAIPSDAREAGIGVQDELQSDQKTWDNQPVAVVAVTWPGAEDEADGWYGYASADQETGELTICRVERSGDLVNIYIESQSPAGDAGEGSSDDEEQINLDSGSIGIPSRMLVGG